MLHTHCLYCLLQNVSVIPCPHPFKGMVYILFSYLMSLPQLMAVHYRHHLFCTHSRTRGGVGNAPVTCVFFGVQCVKIQSVRLLTLSYFPDFSIRLVFRVPTHARRRSQPRGQDQVWSVIGLVPSKRYHLNGGFMPTATWGL